MTNKPDTAGEAFVVETTAATFAEDVLVRSDAVPVVVDFFADWCAPCRQLGPLLERLAHERQGQFALVKVDTDRLPQAAAEFGVQALPTVVALRGRKIVDQFVGALPEPQLRAWLDGIQPSQAERLASEGRRLAESDPAAAEAKLRAAMAAGRDAAPRIELARLLLRTDRPDEAQLIVRDLEARGFLEPEAEPLAAELELRDAARGLGSVSQCRAAVAAVPDDREAAWNLARALAAAGLHEEALPRLLEIVKGERGPRRDEARRLMVAVFRVLGSESELASGYRRRLSAALY